MASTLTDCLPWLETALKVEHHVTPPTKATLVGLEEATAAPAMTSSV
jgi:hypothetical protein